MQLPLSICVLRCKCCPSNRARSPSRYSCRAEVENRGSKPTDRIYVSTGVRRQSVQGPKTLQPVPLLWGSNAAGKRCGFGFCYRILLTALNQEGRKYACRMSDNQAKEVSVLTLDYSALALHSPLYHTRPQRGLYLHLNPVSLTLVCFFRSHWSRRLFCAHKS